MFNWVMNLLTPIGAYFMGYLKGLDSSENKRLKKANEILRRQIYNNVTSIDDARRVHKRIRDKHDT